MFKNRQNLHTHTKFCDGSYTVKEVIEKAIELGFTSIGFSGHALTTFHRSYCLDEVSALEYIKEVKKQRQNYKGKIDVILGVEYDYYSCGELDEFDYVIGSVHYVETREGFVSIDTRTPQKLEDIIKTHFDNQPIKLVEEYFRLLADLPNKLKRVDVIGHFDLLLKSSEIKKIIDNDSSEYRAFARKAIEKLVDKGCFFEVNTGAMARGVRSIPYPEPWALKTIREYGGKVIISSDCHKIDNLDYYFDGAVEYIKENGFREVYTFENGKFIANKI